MYQVNEIIQLLRKCKSLDEAILVVEKNKPLVDHAFIELLLRDATSYKNLGNFKIAADFIELALRCSDLISNQACHIDAETMKADLLSFINDYEGAVILTENIMKNYRLEKKQHALILLVKGNALSKLREYDNALLCYQKSKKLYSEIQDEERVYMVKLNIAKVYLDRGNYLEAERLFVRCENFYQKKGKKYILGLAGAVEGRGKSIRDSNYRNTFELLYKAADLYIRGGSPIRAFFIRLYLIEIYLEMNMYSMVHTECNEARRMLSKMDLILDIARVDWYESIAYIAEGVYEQAQLLINSAKKHYGTNNVELARIQKSEAELYFKRGNYQNALSLISQSRRIFIENNMDIDIVLCDFLEARIKRDINREEEAMILLSRILYKIQNKDLPYIKYACNAILGNVFEKKGQIYEAASFYEEAIELVDEMRFNIEHERLKRSFIIDKQFAYEQLVLIYTSIGLFEDALETAEKSKLQSLIDTIYRKEHKDKSKFKEIEKIQELMGEDEIIIEYFIAEKAYVIFIISKSMFTTKIILKNQDHLSMLVLNLIKEYEEMREGHNEILYKELIEPIKELTDKYSRIFIIPHKFLHSIPFSSLKKGRYLIENYEIIYAPSLIILCNAWEEAIRSRKSLLALANPEGDLPESESEIEQISGLYEKRKILLKNEATKEALLKNKKDFDILHFACHGTFDERNPENSALILADGPLTAIEVSKNDMNASMVVLSACMSGKTRIGAGDEIIGFVRSFLYSKSQTILVSLWEVFEDSSLLFMRTYYELLQTKKASEALRMAQLELMKKYPQPLIWAPYILVGDHR